MAHRTDFRNVAREFCQGLNLNPIVLNHLERMLHDAHAAGVVGEPCRCGMCSPTRPDAQVTFPWDDDDEKTQID